MNTYIEASRRAQSWGRSEDVGPDADTDEAIAIGTQLRIAAALESLARAFQRFDPEWQDQKRRLEAADAHWSHWRNHELPRRKLIETAAEKRLNQWHSLVGYLPRVEGRLFAALTEPHNAWAESAETKVPGVASEPPDRLGPDKWKYQHRYAEWLAAYKLARAANQEV